MQLITDENGVAVRLENWEERRMMEAAAAEYGKEKARQDALTKTYKPKELVARLGLCTTTIYAAIADGRLRATPSGKKGYIISEQACREFLGDMEQAA
jgi:hypothetical protein